MNTQALTWTPNSEISLLILKTSTHYPYMGTDQG